MPSSTQDTLSLPGNYGFWLPLTFDVFQAVGGLGNIALIITLFTAKSIRRHSTWKSFCVAWVISSISYLMIAIPGMQRGPAPPPVLCLTQAVLVYGAPVMCLFAMLACVVQLWIVVSHLTSPGTWKHEQLWQKSLLFVPYAAALVVTTTALAIGLQDPSLVERSGSGIYCIINSNIPGRINVVLLVCAALTCLGFEIAIVMQCRKHKKTFHGQAQLPLGMLVRLIIFTAIGFIGLGILLVFATRVFTPLPNLFIASLPVGAFFIFGTQQDIINVWMCRRSRRMSLESTDSRLSTAKVNV